MIIYELFAILTGAIFGYWVFSRISTLILPDLYQLYYSTSARRFDVIYNVTEENYETLDSIFTLKAKHFEFIEAMRVFEDIARDEVNLRIKGELKIIGNFSLRFLPLVAVVGILFIPVWMFYLAGVAGGFVVPLGYKLVKAKLDGAFSTFASLYIAEAAYSHSYSGGFFKPEKIKVKKDKKAIIE